MNTGLTGEARTVDLVRDINLEVLPPLVLSDESSDGMRELTIAALLASIVDDTISNTTTETNFSQKHTIAANSLIVGQVYCIKATGILSTV